MAENKKEIELREMIREVEAFIENHKNRPLHLLDFSILRKIIIGKEVEQALSTQREEFENITYKWFMKHKATALSSYKFEELKSKLNLNDKKSEQGDGK